MAITSLEVKEEQHTKTFVLTTLPLIATESRVEDDEKEEIRLHQCFEKG